jgi:drug/metabolite transporter (DMT)-like permease
MTAACLLFALMGAAVKAACRELPSDQVVFFRNALGLAALAPLLWRAGRRGLATRRPWPHAARALAGLAAMYCSFYALAHMRLADALVLGYTAPLFMPFLAKFWLGEEIPAGLGRVLAAGFLGVGLILRPGFGIFQPAALAGLAAGLLGAVAQVGIRGLTRTEPVLRIVFYFGLIGSVVSALPAAAGGWREPSPKLWVLLAAMGAVASAAQLLLTRAYREAPPARVGPFIYSAVVFAGLLDWVFWGKLPDVLSAAGAGLVILSGVLAIRGMNRAVPTEPGAPAK